MSKLLEKEKLLPWLEQLAGERVLIAPTRVEELTLFAPVKDATEIVLDYENTALSPKEWLFPSTEVLFTIARKDSTPELVEKTIAERYVIFGIRPCDAKGIAALDLPFLSEPADSLYAQRRAQTALIGMSCLKPAPQCFCAAMGSAPNDASNVDIMLTEVEEGYLVEVVTEKGQGLLEGVELKEVDIEPPPCPDTAAVPAEGITEVITRVFNDPFWARLADRCIHCNICAYVCPTCYCFDIRDYTAKGNTERIRTWESCQSPGFTRIAGGYDPRASKESRLRQRFYHKLCYFPEQFSGPLGCSGCGRCVVHCPVNIDIREVITRAQEIGREASAASG